MADDPMPNDADSGDGARSMLSRVLLGDRDRLGWTRELFGKYDQDQDGELGADELRNYLLNGVPAVELDDQCSTSADNSAVNR